MNDSKLTQDIMILLKKKFNNIEHILNYTNDIQESMTQDDFDTVDMLLDMRAELMDEVDTLSEEIYRTMQLLSDEARIRVSCLLSEATIQSDISFEENKIKEINLMTKNLIFKIIELDQILEAQISARNKLLAMENA